MTCNCEMVFKTVRKHREARCTGQSNEPEYKIWAGILARCNPNSKSTSESLRKYYIGKAKICKFWIQSYSNFLHDMGRRPSKKHSIDRIDWSLGYCRHNCRWATKHEQVLNRRGTKNFDMPCGVRKNKSGTFSARISILGRMFQLGTYSKKKDAEKEFARFQKFIDSKTNL